MDRKRQEKDRYPGACTLTVTLENDVPIETVSQLLGHKSIRTTQIYAKITQRKISNNMRTLRKRLFGEGPTLEKQTV